MKDSGALCREGFMSDSSRVQPTSWTLSLSLPSWLYDSFHSKMKMFKRTNSFKALMSMKRRVSTLIPNWWPYIAAWKLDEPCLRLSLAVTTPQLEPLKLHYRNFRHTFQWSPFQHNSFSLNVIYSTCRKSLALFQF